MSFGAFSAIQRMEKDRAITQRLDIRQKQRCFLVTFSSLTGTQPNSKVTQVSLCYFVAYVSEGFIGLHCFGLRHEKTKGEALLLLSEYFPKTFLANGMLFYHPL